MWQKKMKSNDLEKCKESFKRLNGLHPYNVPNNQVYGDWVFAISIINDFEEETIKKAKEELKIL